MNCDVCIDEHGADGRPDFCEVTTRKARKEHRCSECRLPISAGQQYTYIAMRHEGDFVTFKQCVPCVEIASVFACNGHGAFLGELWDCMDSDVFPELTVRSPCLNRLSYSARSHLTKMWWKWKERSR